MTTASESKQPTLSTQAAIEWRRLRPGQKKFVLLVSIPFSSLMMALSAVSFVVAFAMGVNLPITGFDGLGAKIVEALSTVLQYWPWMFSTLVTAPAALGYIEYKSRQLPL